MTELSQIGDDLDSSVLKKSHKKSKKKRHEVSDTIAFDTTVDTSHVADQREETSSHKKKKKHQKTNNLDVSRDEIVQNDAGLNSSLSQAYPSLKDKREDKHRNDLTDLLDNSQLSQHKLTKKRKRSKERDNDQLEDDTHLNEAGGKNAEASLESHKKKKRKHNHYQPADDAVTETLQNQENSAQGVESHTSDHMTPEERQTLYDNMLAAIPATTGNSKFSVSLTKMNWQQVSFGRFTADDCRNEWKHLNTGIRQYRTLSEQIMDAKNGLFMVNPDRPKMPANVVMRYYWDIKDKLLKKYPHENGLVLLEHARNRFKKLSDEERKRYSDAYHEDLEKYYTAIKGLGPLSKSQRVRSKSFSSLTGAETSSTKPLSRSKRVRTKSFGSSTTHTETVSTKPQLDVDIPDRPSALEFYIQRHVASKLGKNPQAQVDLLREKYQERFHKLPVIEKLKYIDKALDKDRKLMAELREKGVDVTELEKQPCLRSKEQEMKAKEDGAPERPPLNGYGLFTKKHMMNQDDQMKKQPFMKRTKDVHDHWQQLSEDTRNKYNEKVKKMREEFQKYAEQNPGVCNRAKKSKSSKSSSKSTSTVIKSDSKVRTTRKQLWENEPKPPPSSGYQLFCRIKMAEMDSIDTKDRMRAAGEAWGKLSKEQKQDYTEQLAKLKKKYQSDLLTFKQGLSPEELKDYMASLGKTGTDVTAQQAKAAASKETAAAANGDEPAKSKKAHQNKSKKEKTDSGPFDNINNSDDDMVANTQEQSKDKGKAGHKHSSKSSKQKPSTSTTEDSGHDHLEAVVNSKNVINRSSEMTGKNGKSSKDVLGRSDKVAGKDDKSIGKAVLNRSGAVAGNNGKSPTKAASGVTESAKSVTPSKKIFSSDSELSSSDDGE